MAADGSCFKWRLKHLWWLVLPLGLLVGFLAACATAVSFNLGTRSLALSIQTLTPNGAFHSEGVFSHTTWDGPTGSFTAGEVYGIKLGNRLFRFDIVHDPIGAAKRKLPATVQELVLVLDSKDRGLRCCALERLSELGRAAIPAIPALVKQVETGDEQAADTLSTVSKSSPDLAVPLLMNALANSGVDARWRVSQILGEIGSRAKTAMPALKRALDDPDPRVVGHAAIALRKIGGHATNAVTAVRQLLKNPNPEWRGLGAVALAEFGSDARIALPDLVHLLDDTNAQVRAMASRTIGLIGMATQSVNSGSVSEAIPRLRALAQGEDVGAQWATDALSTMGLGAASILGEIYRSADGQRRLSAARALMKLSPSATDALPVLMADLTGTNAGRVHLSAQIVGHLGSNGRPALPQLSILLTHPDVRVRVRAAESIWRLDGRTNEVMAVLLAALSDESVHRGGGRLFAVEVIGEMGPAAGEAAPKLESLLKERQAGLRQAAAVALKKIGEETATR